jgi:hypothetical protein
MWPGIPEEKLDVTTRWPEALGDQVRSITSPTIPPRSGSSNCPGDVLIMVFRVAEVSSGAMTKSLLGITPLRKYSGRTTGETTDAPRQRLSPNAVPIRQSLDIPRDIDAIIGLDILAKTSGFLIDYAAKMISFRNVSASQSNRLTCLTAQIILQGHPVNRGRYGDARFPSV